VKRSHLAAKTLLAVPLVAFPYVNADNEAAGRFVFEEVQRGTIASVIEATGTLEAVETVEVGSEVSGLIAKVFVNFNDPVAAGQPIAEIDRAGFEARVAEARAALKVSKAKPLPGSWPCRARILPAKWGWRCDRFDGETLAGAERQGRLSDRLFAFCGGTIWAMRSLAVFVPIPLAWLGLSAPRRLPCVGLFNAVLARFSDSATIRGWVRGRAHTGGRSLNDHFWRRPPVERALGATATMGVLTPTAFHFGFSRAS
jgi:hypothetical protein